MKKNTPIRIKAAFLMIVFALNTVVGFACALGVDMGFNSKHHHDEEATEAGIHVHADGTKHHHHDKANDHHHESKDDAEKGGCCNDKVINFQNLDKNLNQSANVAINALAFIAILSSFSGIDIFKPAQITPQRHFAFFHPPPPDILIVIHRFQI